MALHDFSHAHRLAFVRVAPRPRAAQLQAGVQPRHRRQRREGGVLRPDGWPHLGAVQSGSEKEAALAGRAWSDVQEGPPQERGGARGGGGTQQH